MNDMSTPAITQAQRRLTRTLATVDDPDGLHQGLTTATAFYWSHADPDNPAHNEARQVAAVWEALLSLSEAVQADKENAHG